MSESSLPAPMVSVVLAVKNGERHIEKAISSILAQTFTDYELVLIDDGSTDSTLEIMSELTSDVKRVNIICNAESIGQTNSLNIGLEAATGEYIARLDGDDTAEPERFAQQIDFLEKNRGVVFAGTGFRLIDEADHVVSVNANGRDWKQTAWLSRFQTAACHPSVMFRRLKRDGSKWFYDPQYRYAQDCDLFLRMLDEGKGVVLPGIMTSYRWHSGAVSVEKAADQTACLKDILLPRAEQKFGPSFGALVHTLLDRDVLSVSDRRAQLALLREMLVDDAKKYPEHRRWFERQSAKIAAKIMIRRNSLFLAPLDAVYFLIFGWRFLVPLCRELVVGRS